MIAELATGGVVGISDGSTLDDAGNTGGTTTGGIPAMGGMPDSGGPTDSGDVANTGGSPTMADAANDTATDTQLPTREEVAADTILDVPVAQDVAVDSPPDISIKPDTAADIPIDASTCFRLLPVNQVRIYPRSGHAADVVGSKIVGSKDSATNGFEDIYTFTEVPTEGQWTTLTFANSKTYRFVKYYGARTSYGTIAEIAFYSDQTKLSGEAFGTVGSRNASGATYDKALDGDTTTFFEGPTASNQYVGYDLGAGKVVGIPTISPVPGLFSTAPTITLSTTTPGATIRYTVDGTDPTVNGSIYSTPFTLAGSAVVKAIAREDCLLDSPTASGTFQVGNGPKTSLASLHIGNSLTDSTNNWLTSAVQTAGDSLDYHRCTIPGIGTWIWDEVNKSPPTDCFGMEEVNLMPFMQNTAIDHLSVQPFPNSPCTPTTIPDPDTDSVQIGDADYAMKFWSVAKQKNPDVQLWIYHQWPDPPPNYSDCLSGGGWTQPSWNPPAPKDWDEAVMNQLAYQEAVRSAVADMSTGGKQPLIIPAGLALLNVKKAIAAGTLQGVGEFFTTMFGQNGTDLHLTNNGLYIVNLTFYACMFATNPVGKLDAWTGYEGTVTYSLAQRQTIEQIVWNTVSQYPWSGVTP